MSVNSKKMQGVPVRTQLGQDIGKVISFDVDADTGRLTMLHVKVSGFVPALLDQEALITWSQVISFSEEEVVVQDAVILEKEAHWVKKALSTETAQLSISTPQEMSKGL
jgi:sporulation protein YlmC with PRC-barrel domain